MSRRRRTIALVVVVALASFATACSDDDASPSEDASPETSESLPDESPGSSVDDSLTVGVLLPLTGSGSEIGTVMNEAVEIARAETSATGVHGKPVRLVVVDESTLDGVVPPSLDGIFSEEVDAIIGPASSLLAARLLPIAVGDGVLTCSPTASTLGLDGFPDTGPLFVRTIPSDSLQAKALAKMLDEAGTDVVLAFVDDAYGRPFMEKVSAELDALGVTTKATIEFDPQESDYGRGAADVARSGSATIGIIGDPEAGPRIVQAVAEVIDTDTVSSIWMNDAMRVPETASVYRRLEPAILQLMRGVSPRSTVGASEGSGSTDGLPDDGRFFAANAYDCMNIIALTADQADVIDGAGMADQIVQVTSGGTSCESFTECIEQLESGRSIDYDGPSGELDLGRNGDPSVGLFDVYHFDERGLDMTDIRPPVRVDSRTG